MNTGPKLKNDTLVFGYDTGYDANGKSLSRQRHYKGPSYFNILETHSNSQSSQETNYSFVYGEEEVKIPKIGKVVSKYCDYNNNRYAADGSVNSGTSCCPNLFYYHNGHIDAEANTNYTYSIVYKHTANYTHPNFMYRYEYTSGGDYIKEGGLHSTTDTRRTHLGNGWYHAWGSFTTTSTTARIYAYSFLYNYGLKTDRFYVAKIALVKNQTGQTHFIIPPHQLLAPGSSSVSYTGSIIDLKKTTDINVVNISFDSDGQPTFDGTDDKIEIPANDWNKVSEVTVEIIVLLKGTPIDGNAYHVAVQKDGGYSGAAVYGIRMSNTNVPFASFSKSAESSGQNQATVYGTQMTTNKYYHLVYTRKVSQSLFYQNGEQTDKDSSNDNEIFNNTDTVTIGEGDNRQIYGNIPVVKIYNTVLTAAEIKSNFNAYKNRFDL